MRYEAIDGLVLPSGMPDLKIHKVESECHGEVREGTLIASNGQTVPVRNFVPRFVDDGSYTENFGLQWNHFKRTQLDRFNGTTITKDRFYSGTGWSPEELRGQRILEAGCGAGRFTQIMLDAGAEVYSLDYSSAVDACFANNGPHPMLTVVQGDIFKMPFRQGWFDKVFCFGVIQHTPDPKQAFSKLLPFLKTGGKLAVDVYIRLPWPNRWMSKYLWRPLTNRIPNRVLFKLVEWYVPRWLPIDNKLDDARFIWRFAKYLRGIVPCWNYTGLLPLDEVQIKEWAILDTFDALSPAFDEPQTLESVHSWFDGAGLSDVYVQHGANGVIGRGTRR